MTDPLADAIPEADLAEQSTPAYPDDTVLPDDRPEPGEGVGRAVDASSALEANPADVVEQSIPVPLLDDEPEDELGY
ncbi:hypothetical protein ACL02S_20140 [Nocardia sp. 004]|uniref:hypothetical protein n=1 Tax=Nocardia sp. 004 TaxID=3385978 RepID=UPI0039A20662